MYLCMIRATCDITNIKREMKIETDVVKQKEREIRRDTKRKCNTEKVRWGVILDKDRGLS